MRTKQLTEAKAAPPRAHRGPRFGGLVEDRELLLSGPLVPIPECLLLRQEKSTSPLHRGASVRLRYRWRHAMVLRFVFKGIRQDGSPPPRFLVGVKENRGIRQLQCL